MGFTEYRIRLTIDKDLTMQLVKTQRDALLRPLQIVSGIVERRHTLPILANILIRKDGERVSFLSTDIEVQITTHCLLYTSPSPRD